LRLDADFSGLYAGGDLGYDDRYNDIMILWDGQGTFVSISQGTDIVFNGNNRYLMHSIPGISNLQRRYT
jgi:hypothetical protein